MNSLRVNAPIIITKTPSMVYIHDMYSSVKGACYLYINIYIYTYIHTRTYINIYIYIFIFVDITYISIRERIVIEF